MPTGKPISPGKVILNLALILAALTASCTRDPDTPSPRSQTTASHDSHDYKSSADADQRPVAPSSEKPLPAAETAAQDTDRKPDRAEEERYRERRDKMIALQLKARDISNRRVLDAMSRVARHKFVPAPQRRLAYIDSPLPIGHEQTISQPYIVALMTQLVDPKPESIALDIGTGSGYQAAVLAELVKTVYSIEIVEPLAREARQRLQSLGYENIHVRHGDGYRGWPEKAPFDIIIVAAAPDHVPQPLVDQLAPGGTLVIPVGKFYQELKVIQKTEDGQIVERSEAPVSFVPMTGEAEK